MDEGRKRVIEIIAGDSRRTDFKTPEDLFGTAQGNNTKRCDDWGWCAVVCDQFVEVSNLLLQWVSMNLQWENNFSVLRQPLQCIYTVLEDGEVTA